MKKNRKVAWSIWFDCYIKCVKYNDENDWYFVKCNRKGRKKILSGMYKSKTNYNLYIWK